ncbi:MAG: hypothetical protein KDA62_02505 [Planctomycetales bacterium]|nr:hypothetical protein [Planctomycetales bacterium]
MCQAQLTHTEGAADRRRGPRRWLGAPRRRLGVFSRDAATGDTRTPTRRTARRALTLMEVTIASTMLATVLTSVMIVMRTGREAWEANQADFVRIQAGHATVRHIVREIRQAEGVTAISASTNNSGSLSVVTSAGVTLRWAHDNGTKRVLFGPGTADQLLAPDIESLNFAGFRADGTTAAANAGEVQCVRVTATVILPGRTNGTRNIRSWVWVRSW